MRVSYASSSTLAQQIRQGAGADVFVSAHPIWMDLLEEEGHLHAETRRIVASNRIVIVSPRATTMGPATSVASSLADPAHRISVGDPDHVPVGMYAKQALEQAGLWVDIADRIIPALDARFALRLVQRGEAERGIMYESDVASIEDVRILATVPTAWHDPIVYEAAVLSDGDRVLAEEFLLALAKSSNWISAGFSRPAKDDR